MTETKAITKTKQAEKTAAQVQQDKSVLYVGPTINGIAITGTVYSDIPDAAKEAKADVPMILNLFIPVKEYAKAERMIDERKGYIYSAYKQALEYSMKKGGKR